MIRPEQKQLFAVVGNPVRHSLSPVMMNAAFESMGIPALYTAFFIDDLPEDLRTLHKTGFSGLSVTVPYKEIAYRLAFEVDETAEEIGAVNTLRWSSQGWEGRNTDWIGALRALSDAGEVAGKSTLVIGAGGAARAIAYGLQRAGALVTIANRCVERGTILSEQLRCEFIPLDRLEKTRTDFEIVVQCTSLGLEGNGSGSPVSESFFRPEMTVMDIVYKPRTTPFSRAARKAGCTLVSGIEMLIYQGAAQLEWWLGYSIRQSPGIEAMREAINKAVNE
ncbi:MAG: shikimate dehydrogenase [Syntrophobacter sp.]